jgi:modulator of FtsH protease
MPLAPVDWAARDGGGTMDGWDSFYLAQAGAAAALAGLIFVSISISLDRILGLPALIDRAFQALTLLLQVLVVSSLCLVPLHSAYWLGVEVLVIGLMVWAIMLRLNVIFWRKVVPLRNTKAVIHVTASQFAASLFPIAGALLMLHGPDAAYWLVPAILLSFVLALTDAWVLLVEIHR